ncbi:MAG: hypothetical protein ACR2M3_11005 [Thermomicrobiales bacterium]
MGLGAEITQKQMPVTQTRDTTTGTARAAAHPPLRGWVGYGTAVPSAEAGVAPWITTVTYSSFAIWGVALGAAATHHYQRTRGRCASCGRG